jgi:hypothetical protein
MATSENAIVFALGRGEDTLPFLFKFGVCEVEIIGVQSRDVVASSALNRPMPAIRYAHAPIKADQGDELLVTVWLLQCPRVVLGVVIHHHDFRGSAGLRQHAVRALADVRPLVSIRDNYSYAWRHVFVFDTRAGNAKLDR